MELIEFKNKSVSELKELQHKLTAELHGHRLKAAAKELKQVHLVRATRRTIARIQTLLAAKVSDSSTNAK